MISRAFTFTMPPFALVRWCSVIWKIYQSAYCVYSAWWWCHIERTEDQEDSRMIEHFFRSTWTSLCLKKFNMLWNDTDYCFHISRRTGCLKVGEEKDAKTIESFLLSVLWKLPRTHSRESVPGDTRFIATHQIQSAGALNLKLDKNLLRTTRKEKHLKSSLW